jgi:hypothetical protein
MASVDRSKIEIFELQTLSPDLPPWSRIGGYDPSDGEIYLPVELCTDEAADAVARFHADALPNEGLSSFDDPKGGGQIILASTTFLRRCYPAAADDIAYIEQAAKKAVSDLIAAGLGPPGAK